MSDTNSNSNSNSNSDERKRKYSNIPNRDMLPGNSSITNLYDVGKAVAADPETDQGKAEQYAEDQLDIDFSQDSLSEEPSFKIGKFDPSKNFNAISAKNVRTLEGITPVSAEERQPKIGTSVKFNELVTVLFIEPEGLSLRTPPLYPTEQQTKAKLEKLANDIADCLVRDVTSEADLENIRSILDKMIKENPNNINRSSRVAQMTGTDNCIVQLSKPNIAFLDRYYYKYEPNEEIKISYLDYAVTLAIERFTQNYNSFTGNVKRFIVGLYSNIMSVLRGGPNGGRRTRRKKRKSKRRSSKRRSSKRRTLKKR